MLLQNCGACYEQSGRYEEALAAYAAAEARYQSLGMNEQQAFIIENRGTVLMAQGRVSDALAAFTYAQQIYAQAGLDFYQAQTLINIGEAHLLLSNYMPSLQAFAQALSLFAQLGGAVDQPILLRQMGDAYLALNLHAEALDTYHQAKAGLQAAGLPLHYALTLWGLGVTQIACNQLTAARQTLAAAAEILYSLDNRPLLSAQVRADIADERTPQMRSLKFLPITRIGVIMGLTLSLLLWATIVQTVQAASFIVNSTADAVDANPGDGVCATGAGECTLRAAIQEANAAAGADTISLPAGAYLIALTTGADDFAFGDFDIAGPLTINGAGAATTVLDATAIERVLEIHPTAGNVTLNGLTLQNGYSAEDGGGIYNTSAGTLRLENIALRNNASEIEGGASTTLSDVSTSSARPAHR